MSDTEHVDAVVALAGHAAAATQQRDESDQAAEEARQLALAKHDEAIRSARDAVGFGAQLVEVSRVKLSQNQEALDRLEGSPEVPTSRVAPLPPPNSAPEPAAPATDATTEVDQPVDEDDGSRRAARIGIIIAAAVLALTVITLVIFLIVQNCNTNQNGNNNRNTTSASTPVNNHSGVLPPDVLGASYNQYGNGR